MIKRIVHPLNWRIISQSIFIILFVVSAGLLVASSHYGRDLEEQIGLPWLFKLRGEIPASNDVVIVSIDQASARALNLPSKPRKWPRSYHGQLVDKLVAHGATAIGFDIIFDEVREQKSNRFFADSINKANNVILFQLFQQEEIFDKKTHQKIPAEKIKLVNPISVLADAAAGVSPFPLPKVPAQVNHVVLYKSILNDVPTLPVTMLQVYTRSLHREIIELVKLFKPSLANELKQTIYSKLNNKIDVSSTIIKFRYFFLKHPEITEKIMNFLRSSDVDYTDIQIKKLRSLINVYRIPDSVYLNLYGRVGSIKTIPYYKILQSDPDNPSINVKNKAVFVGFSERFQPDQMDAFNTVFSDENSGSDISGVEIIATSFSNLLELQSLKVSGGYQDIVLIVLWGIIISILLRFTPGLYQIPVTIILAIIYGSAVYYSFVVNYYWLPFLIPLFIQLGLASFLSFILHYRETQIERKLIRRAFGYHLPVDIVDEISKGLDCIAASGKKVQGIVMATDAQQYTQLSEKLDSNALQNLMNQYYEVLFKKIRQYNGIISDVVGDAAMAIWTGLSEKKQTKSVSSQTENVHQQACFAALEIKSAMDIFNQENSDKSLPTRIGLDSGEFVMGHVGALDHYEYRAIGEIVNTASRIEGVNKILKTNIIVSAEVLSGTKNLMSRELGCFVLAGKKKSVKLYELIASDKTKLATHEMDIYKIFNQGLIQFKAAEFKQALLIFNKIEKDGPAYFYAKLCRKYIMNSPENFNGSVVLERK